jgi:hypothetical protein
MSERITDADVTRWAGDAGVLAGTPRDVLVKIAYLIEDWRRLRRLIASEHYTTRNDEGYCMGCGDNRDHRPDCESGALEAEADAILAEKP